VASTLFRFKLIRACCCIDEDMFQDLALDAAIREDVNTCMGVHTLATEYGCLAEAARNEFAETGYDLRNESRSAPTEDEEGEDDVLPLVMPGPASPVPEGEFQFLPEGGFTIGEAHVDVETPFTDDNTRVSARFVAAAIVQLRSKLGAPQLTEANRIMVEMEYLRMCRNGSVRAVDIVTHQAHVINGFFTEFDFARVARARSRAPAWLRRALRADTPQVGTAVC
jgi:hypothetical protein